MVEVYENGALLEGGFGTLEGEWSLPDFFGQLNLVVSQDGKIIVEFKMNGTLYDLDQLSDSVWVGDGDRIDIITAEPKEIAKVTLKEAQKKTPIFIEKMDEVVDALIRGDKTLAFKTFSNFITDFRDIVQMLQTLEASFALYYDKLSIGDKTVKAFIDQLIQVLSDVRVAMEKEDSVTLTDQLDYELKELLENDLPKIFEVILKCFED